MSGEPREPCWCHDCGTWSFRDEWLRFIADRDTCPVCGDSHPGGGWDDNNETQLLNSTLDDRLMWAELRAVNW